MYPYDRMISTTIVTRNCERMISEVLESLRWCDDIILIDRSSSDHTLEIAATFPNVRVERASLESIGNLFVHAASLAKHDWILTLFRNELPSPQLGRELQELLPDPNAIYSMPLRSHLNGKWIKRCGWSPNQRLRLYNRKHAHFAQVQGWATLMHDGRKEIPLSSPLLRYPYESIADFIDRIQTRSRLYAVEHAHHEKGSLRKAFWRAGCAFFRSYLLKSGWLEGREGVIISMALAHRAFYSQLKLQELNLDKFPTGSDRHQSADEEV
ncbi:MAG: glycosyltransferase family 2 protein [Verrucomicrobia bacterium]|nr:glycosyltransferase family 2 protein [Verrucomicrobiota bacterium]